MEACEGDLGSDNEAEAAERGGGWKILGWGGAGGRGRAREVDARQGL